MHVSALCWSHTHTHTWHCRFSSIASFCVSHRSLLAVSCQDRAIPRLFLLPFCTQNQGAGGRWGPWQVHHRHWWQTRAGQGFSQASWRRWARQGKQGFYTDSGGVACLHQDLYSRTILHHVSRAPTPSPSTLSQNITVQPSFQGKWACKLTFCTLNTQWTKWIESPWGTVLCVIAKKVPRRGRWLNKLWYIHTVEDYQ